MKFWVDSSNNYLGGSDKPITNGIEVPFPPDHADKKWNGSDYDPLPDDHASKISQQRRNDLADRKTNNTPVTREEFNNLLDALGM